MKVLSYLAIPLFIMFFVTIGQIRYNEPVMPGEEMELFVSVDNRASRFDYDNVRIRAFVLDNGEIYSTKMFDLDGGDVESRFLLVDVPYELEDPWLRIVVSDDHGHKRVRHIPLVVW